MGGEAVAIGADNVDSCVPWATQTGTTFAIGGDFWPHGHVALQYGVLRPEGVADRAVFLVDRDGKIRFKEVYPSNQVPPIEPALEVLRSLSANQSHL